MKRSPANNSWPFIQRSHEIQFNLKNRLLKSQHPQKYVIFSFSPDHSHKANKDCTPKEDIIWPNKILQIK